MISNILGFRQKESAIKIVVNCRKQSGKLFESILNLPSGGHYFFVGCSWSSYHFFFPCPVLINHCNPFIFQCPALFTSFFNALPFFITHICSLTLRLPGGWGMGLEQFDQRIIRGLIKGVKTDQQYFGALTLRIFIKLLLIVENSKANYLKVFLAFRTC